MTVASLSGRLLARKGAARPSLVAAQKTPPPHGAAATSPPEPAPFQSATPPADGRVRVSLRLDATHHRRLRLAAVHLDCSLQTLLISALDAYLRDLRLGCACIEAGGICRTGCIGADEDSVS